MKKYSLIPFFIILLFISTSLAQNADSLNASKQHEDSTILKKAKDKKSDAPILTIVEQMPEYPGGEDSLFKYLGEKIKYPQLAKELGISGTVIVNFVVEQDGSLSDISILKDIGGGCGNEAVRVIKSMPNWIPGKQNGFVVRVVFNLPIQFTLTNKKAPSNKNQKKSKKL